MMMEKRTEQKKASALEVNYFMVAFLDLLGQKDAMNKFKGLPNIKNEKEMEEFYSICRETFGAINTLHSLIKDFFDGYLKESILDRVIPRTDIKFQRFSDGLVIFVSLRQNLNEVPVQGIFGVLGACASVCLGHLAVGKPLRGGIEVGLGIEMNENELYGPVIAEAFNLENRVARYPRIVVGKVLMDYLWKKKTLAATDPNSKYASELANCCLELLVSDLDGYPIIDYLGEGFIKHMADKLDSKLFMMAHDYVKKQLDVWKKEQNTKLAFRYNFLINYFESRNRLWKNK